MEKEILRILRKSLLGEKSDQTCFLHEFIGVLLDHMLSFACSSLYSIEYQSMTSMLMMWIILERLQKKALLIPANVCLHCHFSLDSLHLHPIHFLVRIDAHRFRSVGLILCPSWFEMEWHLSIPIVPPDKQPKKNGTRSLHITNKNCFRKKKVLFRIGPKEYVKFPKFEKLNKINLFHIFYYNV